MGVGFWAHEHARRFVSALLLMRLLCNPGALATNIAVHVHVYAGMPAAKRAASRELPPAQQVAAGHRGAGSMTRDMIILLSSLLPAAKLASSGELVPVDQVPLGTEVLVAPGESVPLDGLVVAGESAVDESLLTGGC